MKWKRPEDGKIVIENKFALLPVVKGRDVIWLRWYKIKYEYCLWLNEWFVTEKIFKED